MSRGPRRSRSQKPAEARAPAPPPARAPSWPPWTGPAAAAVIALPLVIPFLMPGWFFGHDNMHLIRLFEQDQMIRAGQFPVRWYADVAAGYGSPHPQYYAPAFYLLAEVFALIGFPLAGALKAAIAVVILGTALATWRFVAAIYGNDAGLVAAAALSYAPYHMLDLFVRTAFSEATVFLFVPLVLLAFHRLAERTTPVRVAAAAASLAGLCLAHTITLMIVPPLVGGWILLLARREAWSRPFLRAAAAAVLLGIGAAAFFIVPLIAEKGAVETEIYAGGYFDYHKHFVTPAQLVYSPWGFGLSREGAGDGISFRLGLLQIAGCLAAALWWKRVSAISPAARSTAIYAALVAAAGVIMALPISEPVWSALPPLKFVQFPWRFLMLPAIGMPFLCAAAWRAGAEGRAGVKGEARAGAPRGNRPALAAGAVALIALASAGMFGFRERIRLEEIGFGGDHTDMRRRDPSEAAASPTAFTRDFVRRQTLHWFDHLPPGGYPYAPKEVLDRPRAETVSGSAAIEILEDGPARWRVRARADQESVIRLNVHRFPGWSLSVDGVPAEPAALEGRRPLLAARVPAGDHEIVAVFRRTPARWAGDTAALISWIAIAALAAAGRISGGRPTSSPASASS